MANHKNNFKGILLAAAAAALFGMSTPLAKLLEKEIAPVMLASLFYLGFGIGFALLSALAAARRKQSNVLRLCRADLPSLFVVVSAGGIFAPVCLMLGLSYSSATTASLLLNLEAVLTALIAWIYFHENCDSKIILGMIAITAGGIMLSFNQFSFNQLSFDQASVNSALNLAPNLATTSSNMAGPLLIALACLGWAIDNNFTRKIAAADAKQIAMIKGLVAGLVNLAFAFALGQKLPNAGAITAALLLGFVGYGLSLVFYVMALRDLGNARTSAYFATAPFLGALLSLVIFHEAVTATLALAALLMGIGVYLHISERHEHTHIHEETEHEHEHLHDLHHLHEHASGQEPAHNKDGSEIPHTHKHRHEKLKHSHTHYPDLHHRHRH
ncbi:DMT family transporter [bacterium]|jgi:drug/metabolite transporter (DMT)-like permease|nr:DMT family transporter [bacterium]